VLYSTPNSLSRKQCQYPFRVIRCCVFSFPSFLSSTLSNLHCQGWAIGITAVFRFLFLQSLRNSLPNCLHGRYARWTTVTILWSFMRYGPTRLISRPSFVPGTWIDCHRSAVPNSKLRNKGGLKKEEKLIHEMRTEMIINMAVALSRARKISGPPIRIASSTTIIDSAK